VLWYNVFGTNDARRKLGGNPYTTPADSTLVEHDLKLNASVPRVRANPTHWRTSCVRHDRPSQHPLSRCTLLATDHPYCTRSCISSRTRRRHRNVTQSRSTPMATATFRSRHPCAFALLVLEVAPDLSRSRTDRRATELASRRNTMVHRQPQANRLRQTRDAIWATTGHRTARVWLARRRRSRGRHGPA